MLQVRIVNLMERIISGSLVTSESFRQQFLTQTQISKCLAEMGKESTFELESGRQIRNGYMGLVVKISNTLLAQLKSEPQQNPTQIENSSNDSQQDTTSDKGQRVVSEFLQKNEFADIWQAWVEGGLLASNELNSRKLGAGQRGKAEEESEEED